MDTLLAICQAVGLAAAAGLAPFFTLSVVALLAAANFGIDLEGTPFDFVESAPGLLIAAIVIAASGVSWAAGDRLKMTLTAERNIRVATAAGAVGGALLGWIALEAEGDVEPLVGLLLGIPVGSLMAAAGSLIFVGAASRLKGAERNALGLFVDILVILTTLAAALVSPLGALIFLAALVYLPGARRRATAKYEGLRVLR